MMHFNCLSCRLVILLAIIGPPISHGSNGAVGPLLPLNGGLNLATSSLQNFNQFKILFNKSYKSIGEELGRQVVFLANLMQVFTSRVKFANKWSGSYRSINQMSDWTEEEFESTLLRPSQYYKTVNGDKDRADEFIGMDFDETNFKQILETEIERIIGRRQQVVAATAAGQDNSTNGHERRKRSLGSVLETLEHLDDKIYTAANLAVQRTLRAHYNIKLASYDPSKPDEIFVDHRSCLGKARSQKRCPCCHVFATLGLYEWAYCNEKSNGELRDGDQDQDQDKAKNQIEFSAQYVLDCGPEIGLDSWHGGSESEVAKFIEHFGFELGERYKFTSLPATCAYNTRDESERKTLAGLIQLDKPKLARVLLNKFDRQLSLGPMTVAIFTSKEFSQYGGGVDEGLGCVEGKRTLHAVLLVGSGRQDGHEYWLMRNSHGDLWGERGYYKLRKDSNCLADFGSGYTLAALKVHKQIGSGTKEKEKEGEGENINQLAAYKFNVNSNYDWRLLAKRYKKYVRGPPKQLPQ